MSTEELEVSLEDNLSPDVDSEGNFIDNRSNNQSVAGPQIKLHQGPPGDSFADNIQSFPESEQADALHYAQIRARQEKLKPASLPLRNLLNSYFFSLDQQGQEELRATNIFHLFYGSGKERDRWKKSKLHTADGKFGQFIKEEFVPKLEELEQEQNTRQSKTA